MLIMGVDPGTEHSGVVWYDSTGRRVLDAVGEYDNRALLAEIFHPQRSAGSPRTFAIETIQNQGLPIGDTTIETAIWIGQFICAWEHTHPGNAAHRVRRSDEQIALCGRTRYRDPGTGRLKGVTNPQIRAAVIARHAPTGGGKTPQVGTKSQPGPLYGTKSHAWSALAVVLTWLIDRGGWE